MIMEPTIKQISEERGYSAADISAGNMFYKRKNRLENPPGEFDKAGRFEAYERTASVTNARTPSRAYPYSELKAARTAKHCAELCAEKELHTKRICRAYEVAQDVEAAHDEIAF
ncbi:hypothetical protein [Roseivivax sp. THAF197b]|uniref:hypothetical protein n=1 Tax=Roseivivax sp. THAF197b TaxID=2588299 RepID=UPI001267F709|nr:hypothetical protein [Roseivivax sp. THAF197b]